MVKSIKTSLLKDEQSMHGAGISENVQSEVSKLAHLGECDTDSIQRAPGPQ